jgi:MFS transporter, DHA1 family, tetracycline resistance protein
MATQFTEAQIKKILLTLFLTVFIDLLGVTIIIPITAPLFLDLKNGIMPLDANVFATAGAALPQIIKDAISYRTIIFGFLVASFPLAQFFGAPYLGALADKIGRKKVLLYSLVGTLIGYVLFAIGVHYNMLWLLFVSRIIDGFTGGNIAIAFSSIADISTPETKTKNFGLIGAAFGLGFIIGPYIGGKLADASIVSWFNFETPFWTSAILCLINIVLVIFYFYETLKIPSTRPINILQGFSNVANAFKMPETRTIFVIVFLLTFGFTIFTQFFQIFLNDKFSFTTSNIGDFFAFIGLFIAFTQGVLTRKLSGKVTPAKILMITGLGLTLAFVLLLVPNKVWLLYCFAPLIAVNQGLLSPNVQTLVSNSVSPQRQGEILGINQSVQSLAMAIPPIVAGYLVSIDRNIPITLAAVFTFLAWVVFMVFYKNKNATPIEAGSVIKNH